MNTTDRLRLEAFRLKAGFCLLALYAGLPHLGQRVLAVDHQLLCGN